jgi:hypothetical protein
MVRGSNGNKIRMIVLKEKKNERTKREIYNVNYKKKKTSSRYIRSGNCKKWCSIEKFIELALTLFFKRQQHRKLNWLDKDQSQFDE